MLTLKGDGRHCRELVDEDEMGVMERHSERKISVSTYDVPGIHVFAVSAS
jgi:hypothetical protein